MKSEWRQELTSMGRRSFLGRSASATAGLFVGGSFAPALAQDVKGLPISAAVATSTGKIRGLVRDGANQFWGVPYGASTAGVNRFMPPLKPASWSGVRDAFQVGQRALQDPDGPISEVWSLDRREPMGEDCLSINIFTSGLVPATDP